MPAGSSVGDNRQQPTQSLEQTASRFPSLITDDVMSFRFSLARGIPVCLLGVLFTSNCFAQNYERYRPLTPAVPPESIPEVPAQPLPGQQHDDRVLVDCLDAVLLLDSAVKVSLDGSVDDLVGVHHDFSASDSVVHSQRIRTVVAAHLQKPMSLRSLNQLARDIAKVYQQCGQPIVDVQIPEQEVSGGTLQLVIIEGKIGQAIIKPGCYFDCEDLDRWITSKRPGARIYERQLSDDLFWLNQSPFRRVTVDFQKGQNASSTDILFSTSDVRPIRGYIGADDTGVRTLNYGRIFAGVVYGDLFGRGDLLSYQYTADEDFAHLEAHSLSYSHQIDRERSFSAYGSFANVSPMLGGGLSQSGQSWQAGMALTRHLVRTYDQQRNFSVGVDVKSTNNNLEFAGTAVSASDATLLQLRIGYDDLKRKSADEYTRLRADMFVGPGGGLTGSHSSTAFQGLRPGTSPDYVYARVTAEESALIGSNWLLASRLTGQVASERLLFSETLGLGGFDTLRGFDQRSFNADNGWIANFEFGPKTHRWGSSDSLRSLRVYSFVDVGNGYVLHAQPGEDAYTLAASAGVGFRFNVSDRLTGRFDWGYGFENIANSERNNRLHLGFTWIPGPRP